jgi:hypothetical protein
MSTNFQADVQAGIVAAMKADEDLATLQVLTSDTDELKETASIFISTEISRELVAGSRVFILDGQAILRVNRSAYTAEESAQIRQNVLAALLNPVADGDFDQFSFESAKVLGFVLGAQNTTFTDEVQLDSFAFKVWAYQLSQQ